MTDSRTFLDIPYDEHIVPFPNTAAVLMQHAREFPDKPALCFRDKTYTYAALRDLCLSADLSALNGAKPLVSLHDTQNGLLLMLILLSRGIPFDLDPQAATHVRAAELPLTEKVPGDFEPPFVHLDDTAMVLDGTYRFSQYNLLVAAQAAGIAFKLFRNGDAVSALPLASVRDLVFGVLGPLYFAKTVRFSADPGAEVLAGRAQYAWCADILPDAPLLSGGLLRDAHMLFSREYPETLSPYARYMPVYFDQAAGLGPVTDLEGNLMNFLGVDIGRDGEAWTCEGHALGQTIVL